MVPDLPIVPNGSGPLGGVRPEAPGTQAPAGSEAGLRFRALLDQLEGQARALEHKSGSALGALDLKGAVEGAKSSLVDALELRDRLLEAYRAHQTGRDEQRS